MPGRFGPVYRAKVDFDVLEQAKWDVVALACCADLSPDYAPSGYPHHFFMHKPTTDPGGEWDIIEIEGGHARGFCNVAMTNDVYALREGESQATWILEPDGRPMSGAVLKRPGIETTCFQLMIPKSIESRVAHWLRALSDGYVRLGSDLNLKTPGPVVIRRLPHELAEEWDVVPQVLDDFDDASAGWAFHKPFWVGQRARADAPGDTEARPAFEWEPAPEVELQRTVLNRVHRQAGAKMVPFAGWEMPVRYSSVQEEHLAVRQSAGLFDVSHMGLFEFSGENVHLFLNTLTTNDVSLLGVGVPIFVSPGPGWAGRGRYLAVPARGRTLLDGGQRGQSGKDWAWVNAVRDGKVMIDRERPWSRALGTENVRIRDLRDRAGSEMPSWPYRDRVPGTFFWRCWIMMSRSRRSCWS